MSEIENKTFESCGQTFYVVSRVLMDEIKNTRQFRGIALRDLNIHQIEKLLDFTEENVGFQCGIFFMKISKDSSAWIPMLFYEGPAGKMRVVIENAKCDCCKWQGIIANPAVPFLFDMVPNRHEEIKKALQYSVVPCPQCGHKLSRTAIWVNNYERLPNKER